MLYLEASLQMMFMTEFVKTYFILKKPKLGKKDSVQKRKNFRKQNDSVHT